MTVLALVCFIGVGATVIMDAPFFLMQPGMGAGIATSKTPRPNAARLQSLITHAVFGLGLYGAGWAAKGLAALRTYRRSEPKANDGVLLFRRCIQCRHCCHLSRRTR